MSDLDGSGEGKGRSPLEAAVADHYGSGDLLSRIMGALRASGANLDALTPADLKAFDALHIRGIAATEELAAWAGLEAGQKVIDVGCGIGGPSRYLADRIGCEVTGVDLTEEFCRVAERLSEIVGLKGRTRYVRGSALALPFPDDAFDIAWTEHAQMNIADKFGFYNEIARVLKPGGCFAFHDVFSLGGDKPDYPVPWAATAEISHLQGIAELRVTLIDLGFRIRRLEDKTAASAAFFRKRIASLERDERPQDGLKPSRERESIEKFRNLLNNLEAGRLQVFQGTARASAQA